MSKKPDHIILMVADSLRYDSVHNQENLLPYITNNGTTFTEARSAGCWTLPATSSLFTGKMPHEHGATAQTRAIRKDIPTLAEKMKEELNVWLKSVEHSKKGSDYIINSVAK